jgi:hypothetical protein
MPLIHCLGVSKTSKSFILAFCFITSEGTDNWGFVLECLERIVFNRLSLPCVVVADQAGDFARSVLEEEWDLLLRATFAWRRRTQL